MGLSARPLERLASLLLTLELLASLLLTLELLTSLLGSIAVLVWRRLRLSPCLKLAGANPSFWDRPPTFRTKFTHVLFSFLFCLYQYKFSHPKFVWTHSPFSFAK